MPKVDGSIKSDEDYYNQININDFGRKIDDIENALFDYLDWFDICPNLVEDQEKTSLLKITWNFDKNEKQAIIIIIKLARLLAYLRGVVPTWHTQDTQGSEYAYALPIIEEPDRAMTILYNLARGHALSKGRNHITVKEDVPLIVKVVLSTASIERVTIFDILLAYGGHLNTNQVTKFLNVSEPTARRTMTELKALGLVDMKKEPILCDDKITRDTLVITLKEQFDWFLTKEFQTLREGFEPTASTIDATVSVATDEDEDEDDNNSRTLLENLTETRKEKTPPCERKNNEDFIIQGSDSRTSTSESVQKIDENNLSQGGNFSFTASSEIPNKDIEQSEQQQIPDSIYRLGHSDTWGCKNCKIRDDKWGMQKHDCKGLKQQ